MLNSISSFLFGSSGDEPMSDITTGTTTTNGVSRPNSRCRLKETSTDGEWVLIDKSSRESSPDGDHPSPPPSPSLPASVGAAARRAALAPLATSPLAAGGESCSDSDNGSDISTLPDNACSGETWLVTPPPCFTAAGNSSPRRMEQSPMENLLIEHPSMSVYRHRRRQNSAGLDSDESESDGFQMQLRPRTYVAACRTPSRAANAGVRRSPRRHRAVAARAGLSSTHQAYRSSEVANRRNKKRQMSISQLARSNLTAARVSKRNNHRGAGGKFVMQPAPRTAGKRC